MFLEQRPAGAGPFTIRHAATGGIVASPVEGAFTRAARRRGLLGRSDLPGGHGILIAPCWSIHTFFMQFAIDVLFVTRDGRVVKTRARIPPGRLSAALGSHAVLEMPAGSIASTRIAVGDRLELGPAV